MKKILLSIFLLLNLVVYSGCEAEIIEEPEQEQDLTKEEDKDSKTYQVEKEVKEKELILVVDLTTSMIKNDPDKFAINSMSYLVDLIRPFKGFNIGIVTFSDKIIYSTGKLIDVDDQSLMDQLQKEIKEVEYGGHTNVSIGLEEAIKILDNSDSKHGNAKIVIMTDGERFDIPGKTDEDKQEADSLISRLENYGNEIYTILTYGDSISLEEKHFMNELAENNGGFSQEIETAKELKEAILAILDSYGDIENNEIDSGISQGIMKSYDINIDKLYDLLSISIFTDSPYDAILRDAQGNIMIEIEVGEAVKSAENVRLKYDSTYSVIDVKYPTLGTWTFDIRIDDGDYFKIDKIFDGTGGDASAVIDFKFKKPDKVYLDEENIYEFKLSKPVKRYEEVIESIKIEILDSNGEVIEEFTPEYSEGIKFDYTFIKKGNHKIKLTVKSSFYSDFEKEYTVPVTKFVDKKKLMKNIGLGALALIILLIILYFLIKYLRRERFFNYGEMTIAYDGDQDDVSLDRSSNSFTLYSIIPSYMLTDKSFETLAKKVKFTCTQTNNTFKVSVPKGVGTIDNRQNVNIYDGSSIEIILGNYEEVTVTYTAEDMYDEY